MLAFTVLCLVLVQSLGATPYRITRGTRIVNGTDAQDNEVPNEISINFQQDDGHTCGGSILTDHWLITAAHCCDGEYAMYVLAGMTKLDSPDSERYEIEKMLVHGDYEPEKYWRNDVCLMKVRTPFKFGERIKQATLADEDYEVDHDKNVRLCGWGYTADDGTTVPNMMQCLDYEAISNDQCSKTGVQMFDGYLCIRPPNYTGACNGDSGSPVMQDGVQIGVASWVIPPCGDANTENEPDFAARISHYIPFIKQNIDEADQLITVSSS